MRRPTPALGRRPGSGGSVIAIATIDAGSEKSARCLGRRESNRAAKRFQRHPADQSLGEESDKVAV